MASLPFHADRTSEGWGVDAPPPAPVPRSSSHPLCPATTTAPTHRVQLVSMSPSADDFCACTVALSISMTRMPWGHRSRHARVSMPLATLTSCGRSGGRARGRAGQGAVVGVGLAEQPSSA